MKRKGFKQETGREKLDEIVCDWNFHLATQGKVGISWHSGPCLDGRVSSPPFAHPGSKALRPLQMALEEEEARALRACNVAEEARRARHLGSSKG